MPAKYKKVHNQKKYVHFELIFLFYYKSFFKF